MSSNASSIHSAVLAWYGEPDGDRQDFSCMIKWQQQLDSVVKQVFMVVYRHFGPKTLRHQCRTVRKTYRHWCWSVQTDRYRQCWRAGHIGTNMLQIFTGVSIIMRWHHLWQPLYSSPCCRQHTAHEQTTHEAISADDIQRTGSHVAWPLFY